MTNPLQRLWCVYHGIIFLYPFASPTCALALFYACQWELLCNKRVSAEPFLKGPQWVDNRPPGKHRLLWRLKWGDPTPSLYCVLAFVPPAPHFLPAQCLAVSISAWCFRSFSLCACYRAFPFMVQLFLIFFSHLFLSAPHLCFLVSYYYYYYYFLSSFISSSLQSTSTSILCAFPSLCPSFHPISLSISPPPAVAADDKPPYTILCAQAALDKSCSVEGEVMGVGAGWGPPEKWI